jgi:hypothetical protein
MEKTMSSKPISIDSIIDIQSKDVYVIDYSGMCGCSSCGDLTGFKIKDEKMLNHMTDYMKKYDDQIFFVEFLEWVSNPNDFETKDDEYLDELEIEDYEYSDLMENYPLTDLD